MDGSLLLTGQDRDRLKVLHEVRKGHITQRQGAAEMGLSVRWVKKLLQRMRGQGDRAVMHGLRGRPSNRKLAPELVERATALIRERYRDYGPTQAAEILAEDHGIVVSRETLRQWMIGSRLWRSKKAKVERVHGWRARRQRRGELVQWDTSEHDWLEGRGPKLYLIAMIDDATSQLTARFALSDSTAENMRLLWDYLERHGRPLEFYTDKASLFTVNRPLHYNKHLPGETPKTQIGRALEELRIGWVAAQSPQAKGRIERCFGTLQDRLVKALRRAQIDDLESANRFLVEEYLPDWNRRFCHAPTSPADAHRPLGRGQELASILSYSETRQVGNDFTVSWMGGKYQIPLVEAKPRMRKQSLRVEQRLDGGMWVVWQGRTIALARCVPALPQVSRPEVADAKHTPSRKPGGAPNRRWMENFWHGDPAKKRPLMSATPVALRAPSVADIR